MWVVVLPLSFLILFTLYMLNIKSTFTNTFLHLSEMFYIIVSSNINIQSTPEILVKKWFTEIMNKGHLTCVIYLL